MARDDDVQVAEPTETDERRALAFLQVVEITGLRGSPQGHRRCGTCQTYTAPARDVSYCWHEQVQAPVGRSWTCDHWQPEGDSTARPTADDLEAAGRVHREVVDANGWRGEPRAGQRCDACVHYLDPEASASYCWHPRIRRGVGADHRCRWFQELPHT